MTSPATWSLASPALWAVLLPAAGVVLALAYRKRPPWSGPVVLGIVHAGVIACAAALVPGALKGLEHEVTIAQIMPDVSLTLRVDAAGALFGATTAVLWAAAFAYGTAYLGDDRHIGRYHAFFMLCLAGVMGVAYAGNLVTLIVFYELFSLTSCALVVHEGTTRAIAAGRKYLAYVVPAGSLLVMGTALAFTLSRDLTFRPGGLAWADSGAPGVAAAALILIAGFAVKAALVPVHGWVADAHPAAPAPFSAVLSGVMVAAGAFAIVRVVYGILGVDAAADLGVDRWLAGVAAFTAIAAAVVATGQDDLKRRLAYSTISQMSYVVLGLSLLGGGALAGALVHVTNHAAMKGALFLCAGVFVHGAGVRRVSEMGGIARRFPVTTAAFTIAAIAMIGIPPLAGLVSKWYLGRGMLEGGHGGYLLVLLGGAAFAAAYLLPVVKTAYFGGDDESGRAPRPAGITGEAPAAMLVPIVVLVALTILLGTVSFLPGMPLSLATAAAEILAPGR